MSGMKVHGADRSHFNEAPDLQRARAAGLLWLYNKVTEGEVMIDKTYSSTRKEAKSVGMPFGGYHFARPDSSNKDARDEARYFMKALRPQAGDLVPVLDFEVSAKLPEQWAKEFMAEVERLLGKMGLDGKPMHYGPNDFGKDYDYLRWVPRYNKDNRRPDVPWDIWQFSNGDLGVPHSFPGLPGRYDLNTMRDGLGVNQFRLMKHKDQPKYVMVDTMHCSMQYSDTPDQMNADANAIFARAAKRDVGWVTGTEAGQPALRAALKSACEKYGFRFYVHADSWVAVSRERIDGNFETGFEPVLQSTEGAGRHTDRDLVWASWDDKYIGHVTVGTIHYLTHGRKKGDPNYELNLRICRAIADWGRVAGAGKSLVFYGGDQNIVDRDNDTFAGAPFTSAWDELGHWESTGHGNIDVIASYDEDVRVEAAYCRALDDAEFKLNADHYPVEAGFHVRQLPLAA